MQDKEGSCLVKIPDYISPQSQSLFEDILEKEEAVFKKRDKEYRYGFVPSGESGGYAYFGIRFNPKYKSEMQDYFKHYIDLLGVLMRNER